MQRKPLFIILILVILLIVITTSALIYQFILTKHTTELVSDEIRQEVPSKIYGVVIDAGSTGTRINGFKFKRNDNGLVLEGTLWNQSKPGLSSLDPMDAQQQIKDLLVHAENFVPEEFRKDTLLKLKATAGLRLLDPQKSQEILDAVRQVIQSSKFLTSSDSVEIMDGDNEGVYSWLSINFLRNLMKSSTKVAALDLGGGSTQVAYEVTDKLPQNLRNFTREVKIFDRKSQVFVISYLGLGLMAFRKTLITREARDDDFYVNSDCINSKFPQFEWTYQNLIYNISPKSTDSSTFDECVIAIRKIVSEMLKPKIPSLQNETINAFSYFYDRSVDAYLIKKNDEGQDVEVEKFRLKATENCEEKRGNDPWLCLDLTYMYVLLQDGYGLRDDKNVKLFSKIDGHEANWALGSFLQDYMAKVRKT